MADELTVLLVGASEPDEKLLEQLEKQGVFAEQCELKELSNMLALVEPVLVVQLGGAGAVESADLLKTTSNVRRVRLVIVADRSELPALRQLDRSVVVSLLATDIAPAVIATRVAMLAKKGPGKTVPPPAVSSPQAPRVGLSPKSAKTPPRATPKKPTPAPPSVAKVPRAAPAPTPAVAKAPPASASKISKQAEESGDKTPIPVAKPHPSRSPKITSAKPEEDAPQTVRAPQLALGGLKDAVPRIAIAVSDITRGDLIACAMREAKIQTRLMPLDAAATRWPLLKSFRPNILLADRAALQEEGKIWYELYQADAELRRAKVILIDFARVFNEGTGEVNLRTLIPQIPQLSAALNDVKTASSEDDPLDDDERPTLIHEPTHQDEEGDRPTLATDPPDQFEDKTAAFDLSNLASEVDAEFAALEQEKVSTVEIQDADDLELDPAPNSVAPESLAPESLAPESLAPESLAPESLAPESLAPESLAPELSPSPPESSGESSLASSTVDLPAAKSSGKAKWFVAAALLLGAGGAAFAWQKSSNNKIAVSKSASAAQAEPIKTLEKPTAEAAPPAAESEKESEPAKPEDDEQSRLWHIASQEKVPTCEELVTNLEELQLGGIQQATLSWDRARKTMVLGDLDKAQRFMCEAALIHPESLALEGLVGIYVSKRAPQQALEWTKKALAIRPDRRKTRELEGDVMSLLGKPDEARKIWAETLKVDPSDQKTLSIIAEQYVKDAEFQLRGGAVSQAELMYRRAAILAPENAEAAAGLAAALAAAGNTVAAKAWVEKVLALEPEHAQALVVQADLLFEAGEKDAALNTYRRVLETDPGNARAHQQIFKLEPK